MSDMKCPFCKQELRKIHPTYVICDNCRITGEDKLWQELIRTRKALDVATKCINWVIDTFQKGLEHESDVVGCCELSLERIKELEQKDK